MAEKAMHDCEPDEKGECPYPETPVEALGNWVWLFVEHSEDGSTSSIFNKLQLPSDQILGVELKFSSDCPISETLVLHSLVINGLALPTSGNQFTYNEDEETHFLNSTLTEVLELSSASENVSVTVNLCKHDATKDQDVSGNLSFSVFTR
ncbi:MAG: hypothetical protein ABJN26_20910 [Stappiaceae bacterium]